MDRGNTASLGCPRTISGYCVERPSHPLQRIRRSATWVRRSGRQRHVICHRIELQSLYRRCVSAARRRRQVALGRSGSQVSTLVASVGSVGKPGSESSGLAVPSQRTGDLQRRLAMVGHIVFTARGSREIGSFETSNSLSRQLRLFEFNVSSRRRSLIEYLWNALGRICIPTAAATLGNVPIAMVRLSVKRDGKRSDST